MTASFRVEPYMYDVYLLGYDRTMATGNADEEAIGRSEDFACALVEYLETKCNLNVFFDCRDVNPGQSVFDALFDVLEKSKFIVPVMCPAFIQDCWSKYITDSAFLDRLGSVHFIPVCALGVTQKYTRDKMKKYRVIRCLYFKADAVLPEDDPEALDKLRRALTAGVSQPVQDDRNNEGHVDESHGEISQPQEESAPPYEVIYSLDDVTGHQPLSVLQRQTGRVESRQEGMDAQDGTCRTGDEGPHGPHFSDETVEGQPQPGPSSLGDNGLPSQDSPPLPPPPPLAPPPLTTPPPPPPPPPLALVDTSHIRESGFADAPEDRGPPSPLAAWYSPVSPVPQTQWGVFEGLNREDRGCEAISEETAEEREEQENGVEDASGENSVQVWMGSLSSFLRDVAPALWTCVLYTENSTPQLTPAKSDD